MMVRDCSLFSTIPTVVMDTPAYVYQRLKGNGASSIRLLTLLPGPLSTELWCEINEVPFGQTGINGPPE
jgi:hypothetical protein